jgi:hypothetical protein
VSHEDPDSGVRHIHRLLELSESLRAVGVSVYQHDWRELAMGSWSLTAGGRHRSYLFTWDGRNGTKSVLGPFHSGQGSGSSSPSIANEQFGIPPVVDPFQYVERFFQSDRNA